MVMCAASNCKVRYGQGVSMFSFPIDKRLRKRWVQKLKKPKYNPSKHSKLCERHFEDSEFTMDRGVARSVGYCKLHLKKDAIPSIFDYTPKDKKRKSEEKRLRKSKLNVSLFTKREICKKEIKQEPLTDIETAGILLGISQNKVSLEQSSTVDNASTTNDEDHWFDSISQSTCVNSSTQTTSRHCVNSSTQTTSRHFVNSFTQTTNGYSFNAFTQTSYHLVKRRHVKLQTDKEVSHQTAPPKRSRNTCTST